MEEKFDVCIFTTGGTIDKSYDEQAGHLENRRSEVPGLLSRLRLPHTKVHVASIMAKDSLDMTHRDRSIIAQRAQLHMDGPQSSPLVIIHGTDTMDQTAKALFEAMPSLPAPVVFTGSMRPLGFADSDAVQNMAEALVAAKLLAPGVYIAFHGQIFTVPWVKKDHQGGTFVSLPPSPS